jgi:hypothetical protein
MGSKKRPSTKTAPGKRVSARERMAAARAAEKRRERRRWITTFAVAGTVVAALAVGVVWTIVADDKPAALPHPAAASGTSMPPWPLPGDPVAGAKAAGLDVQPMEGTAKHFHAHLDVLVNGQNVPVPANLGVAAAGNAMAELHTHDATGMLHIEAPTPNKSYTLGQVFDEWNVMLSATALGGLKTDATHTLTAYINGKPQAGEPAAIELTPHRQIALVYGPKDAKVKVPAAYAFPAGE